MNRKVLLFVIAVFAMTSFVSCSFANVPISDYVLPEPVKTFSVEDFYGIWRVTYLADASTGEAVTFEDFVVEAIRTGQTSIRLGGALYNIDSLGPDYCRVFGSNSDDPICSFEIWYPFVGSTGSGYRLEDGRLVMKGVDRKDLGVYELLSDGNMWYYRFDDVDKKQIYVRQDLVPDTNPRNIASPAAS